MIKGLLFDKDGTLFDFHETWGGWARTFLTGLAGGDQNRARELAQLIHFDFDTKSFGRESVVISDTPDMIAATMIGGVPEHDQASLTDYINQTAAAAETVAPVDLPATLDQFLGLGLVLGVATNDAEAPARAHLSGAGVIDRFAFVAGSDSGFGGKPDTGMQMAFCAETGLKPSEVAMVGDSAHDLVAGRDAGMKTIGVLTGPAPAEELKPLSDVVLADIGHIAAWLKNQTAAAE